jgi:hemoglobin
MEWATEEVLSYAPSDSKVAADLPVPHWSWNGLE